MSAVTAEQLDGLRGRLRSFCYQMLGSPFDAEDAVQTSWSGPGGLAGSTTRAGRP